MGFHYGYEKRKFDTEWTRLEQEYRAAGMDDTPHSEIMAFKGLTLEEYLA